MSRGVGLVSVPPSIYLSRSVGDGSEESAVLMGIYRVYRRRKRVSHADPRGRERPGGGSDPVCW